MNADLGKERFSDEEITEYREQVRRIRDEEELSWSDITQQSGIPPSTMSSWTDDKYPGDNCNIAQKVKLWLQSREEKAELISGLQTDPGFAHTGTAKTILNRLKFAQALGDFAVIGGVPGIGKTSAVIQYAATRPRVFVATMSPATRGVGTMLVEVLRSFGEKEPKGTPATLAYRVIELVGRGRGALIVIDEAQNLTEQAIEQLRAIHDETGTGLALVGNEEVYTRLDGVGSKACFAQVASRVGIRFTQRGVKSGDVETICDGYDITDKACLNYLHKVAAKPGALRNVSKTIVLASLLANGNGDAIRFSHLKDAWAQRGQRAAN